MKHNSDIDFIIMWVDSNDPAWQKKRAKYCAKKTDDNSIVRYRDWDNLRYWFRGVSECAPWVRKIFFVTDGQKPDWLNTNNDSLKVVDHKDYIDAKFLPLFNSSAIEIGLHRIPGLSEKFVLFNDDVFLINKVQPNYYFKNNLPIDIAGLTRAISTPTDESSAFQWLMYNDYNLINRKFDKNTVLKKNFQKWFKLSYGKDLIRTLLNCNRKSFDGIINPHLSAPYLRQDFEKVWKEYHEELMAVYNNRFRSKDDINQYVFRFYRMCEGSFFPRETKGRYLGVKNLKDIQRACEIIEKQQAPEICINDCWETTGFESAKNKITQAFNKIFPNKCEYEV